MNSQYSLKGCELICNCPYARKSICYSTTKKKRGCKEVESPKVVKEEIKCVYKSQNVIIDATTRPHVTCYQDLISKKKK